jgi:hypothetical protein
MMAPYLSVNTHPLRAALCTGAVAVMAIGVLVAWALA